MSKKELRVGTIKNGTVIDHIKSGFALKVVKILGVDESIEDVVSIAMNVPSKKKNSKDIVKVEGKELASSEVDKIALIAPNATINIIRNYEVVEKNKVKLPSEIVGVVKCANSNCITNTEEPVTSKFKVINLEAVKLKCRYCGRKIEEKISEYIV